MQIPATLGASAALSGSLGIATLLSQLLHAPHVPALHTIFSAAAGAASALLLRRHLLLGAVAAKRRAGEGPELGMRRAGSREELPDVETAANGAASGHGDGGGNGGAYTVIHGAPPFSFQGRGGGGGEAGSGGEGFSFPQRFGGGDSVAGMSPSKAKAGELYRIGSKSLDRRMAGPQFAAGAVALVGLSVHAVPLGWRLAQRMLVLSGSAGQVVMPAALLLVLHGLAAGGAMAAIVRGSRGPGALAGGLVGCVAVAAAVLALLRAPSLNTEATTGDEAAVAAAAAELFQHFRCAGRWGWT
jgi:hypothetical protein